MRLILFVCLLFSLNNASFGQKFSASFKGFQTSLPDAEIYQQYEYSEISLDRFSLPDSIYVNQLILSSAQTEILITSMGGFGFSTNMELDLTPNLAFEIGAGIDNFKFNIGRNAGERAITILSTERVPPPPPVAPLNCDNFISDLQEVIQGEDFRMISFYIPAKFYYSIWDGEIRFFAGGYFSKPLSVKKRSTTLTLETETIEDENVCIFTHNSIVEDRISDLRSVNYGITAGFEYSLFKNLAFNLSYERGATYFFSENDTFPSLKDDFPEIKSSTFAFGIKYIFNP